MRHATIDDYRWLYAHGYMPDGLKCARAVMLDIVERCPGTFLDFGCGRGDLVRWINKKTQGRADGIDPATLGTFPSVEAPYDWLISCDVFEHISYGEIDPVLAGLPHCASKGLLLTIANMPDPHEVNGEMVELHLIQEPMPWWTEKLREHFPTATIKGHHILDDKSRFAIVVEF
jgi:cyclopropane fatty-acyl-phospholipid synthase-like methyltransferase